MINIALRHNYAYPWFTENGISVKGIAFDENGNLLESRGLCAHFQNIDSPESFRHALQSLNGIFAVVIQKDATVWAAVDRLRNFPLLYYFQNNQLIISDDYRYFLSKISAQTNHVAERTFMGLGFVLGKNTLLNEVFQLQSGEFLIFNGSKPEIGIWHQINVSVLPSKNYDGWKNALKEQIFRMGKKLSHIIGNQPIALPLSGGFDSRLLGLLLKLNGHKNVFCFTYGNPNYWEVKVSKQVAQILGFDWQCIDYLPYTKEDYIHDPEFLQYVDYVGNSISFPYIVEYFSARLFAKEYQLPKDTFVVTGHSGDMIAGSHFLPDMRHFKSPHDLAFKIFRKNVTQIPTTPAEKDFLLSEIVKDTHPEKFSYSHLAHDDWNISQRQSKQIVNSSKVWDYFGYRYLMPFWDNDFTDFCLSIPFSHRLYKKLYDEVLQELFAEHNLIFTEDDFSKLSKKKAYLRIKIKESFPLLMKLKKNALLQQGEDFFYFNQFLKPMLDELPDFSYKMGSAVLSAWYIKHVEDVKKAREI